MFRQSADNMEATAVCTGLLMNVLMALVACAQNDGAVFPRILPNRLQFFEYESISFNCEFDGSAGNRVMRKLQKIIPTNISKWATAGSHTLKPAFSSDSGQYWCEDGDGLRSNAVNITVTAGSVILESPVLPVNEGDPVTLYCKKKKSTSDFIADFYKDGLHLRTGYKGILTISNVSTSDEGLYKCDISGDESPESRLAVRAVSEPREEAYGNSHPLKLPVLLGLVVSFLTVALLLLVFGVPYSRKHRGTKDITGGSTTRVSGGDGLGDPQHAEYAVVKKPRRGKVPDDVVDPIYAVVTNPRKDKVTDRDDLVDAHAAYAAVKRKEKDRKATTTPCRLEENVLYSVVNSTVTESRDT